MTPESPGDAGAPSARGAPRAREIAERLLAALMRAMRIPGLGAGLSLDGRVVWQAHAGVADLATGAPVTAGTLFRLGSISKSLTGTLAARLAQEGEIDLDRPVLDHLEDLPDHYATLTTREILSFTSGIPAYADKAEELSTTHHESARDLLPRFIHRPLAHEPGRGYLYSSYAYVFAAVVLEAATGLAFPELMRRRLLEPLGMRETVLEDPTRPHERASGRYDLEEDRAVVCSPAVDYHGRAAASGYGSTVGDMLRFAGAHTGPGFLAQRALDEIAQRRPASDHEGSPWGLGWRQRRDWDGRPVLFSEGQTIGCNGCLLVYPGQGAAFALLSNLGGYRLQRIGLQPIVECFLAERAGTLGPVPQAQLGAWELRDAANGRPVGSLRVESERDLIGGKVLFEGLPDLRIEDGFAIGADAWLITTREDVGLQPVRFRNIGERRVLTLLGLGRTAQVGPRGSWA